MDSVIAVLPAHVIDQIAAGEVIERPSSVVKELVDNALDAGARTISIETIGGGRSLVRVADDGAGMSPRDAALALERHATSKLRELDDLWHLTSMGFRGEALAAIASVSRLALTTRRGGDLAATRVVVEAGRLLSITEVGAAAGTTVEVVDLLHNLPARLKFLKGESTEASHITELVAKLAMAHPHVHFRLRHNGRTALEVPPDRDGFARAQALLGPRVAARLVAVVGEESGLRVAAYLGAPDLAQTTARGVQIFVGKRPVRDRGLLHALTMGYGELIARGRHPVAVLHLDAPAGAVDVNVHPQKQEVRFADPNAVAAAVRHVVQTGVASAPWRAETGLQPVQMMASIAPPALPFDRPATAMSERFARDLRRAAGRSVRGQGQLFDAHRSRPDDGGWRARDGGGLDGWAARRDGGLAVERRGQGGGAVALGVHDKPDDVPAAVRDGNPTARAWAADIQARTRAERAAERRFELRETGEARSPVARQPFASDDDLAAPAQLADGSAPIDAAQATPGYFARLRYLGQLDLTYLVCEADGELVLVDQHAAHERVELARLLARHTARDVAIQRMLFPVTIDATPAQLALVERVRDVLAEVGYEAEAFGKATLAIKAVPAGIRHGDPAQLLRRLLAEWERDGTPDEEERVARVLAEIACHSVVRAGDRLVASEAEALLHSLDDVDPTTPAPHGKALLLRLPLVEIGRRFGR